MHSQLTSSNAASNAPGCIFLHPLFLSPGALFGAAFAFAPAGRASLAVLAACGYNGVSVSAWNALDTYSAEVVPTAVRTTAIGLMSAAGRFGAIAVRTFCNMFKRVLASFRQDEE